MSLQAATYILAGLFALAGALALYVAAVNAEWFFRSPNVRILTGRMPRTPARILYALLGLAILAMSASLLRTP